jgi:predicted RND superfamily exporter protein
MNRRIAILWVVGIVGLTLFLGYHATKARVSYEFEDFFPAASKEVTYFKEFRSTFETDNDFVMLAIVCKNGVFQSDFLDTIRSLTADLSKLPYVQQVSSPTNLRRVQREPLSGNWLARPILSKGSTNFARDSVRIYADPTLVPNFFSKDGTIVNILMKHEQRLSKRKGDELIEALQVLLESYPFKEYHLAGRSVAQSFYVDLMGKELIKFTLISAVIAMLFLHATYRNFWSVAVPLAIVLISAVWTIGLMVLMGKPLDIMLTVLPTMLFIVGISDVIHLYTKFLFLKREGMEKMKAISKTMKDVGLATLLTSITTAIGFSTLYFIGIPIIQEFGLIMGMGVLVTFVVTFLAFTSFLTLSPERYFSPVVQTDFWRRKLAEGFIYTLRKGKMLLLVTLGFTAIAFALTLTIKQENVLLEDLPDENELFDEISFFDRNIVGMRPFEMGLELKDTSRSFFDPEILAKMDELDHYLLEEYGVRQLFSLSMLLKKIHFDLNQSKPEAFELPADLEIPRYQKNLERSKAKDQLRLLLNRKTHTARFTARTSDSGSKHFEKKNAEFERFFKESGLNRYFTYHLTGSASLIDLSNRLLSENLLLGLFIAFGLVALLAGIVFKSWQVVGVILFVNAVPLLGIAGVMGLMGIELKISTSVIFTIAYGIAVDDSIHFMSKFKLEYRRGKSLLYALKRTFLSTGRAIVLTTIILLGGFVLLIVSSFKGTFYIGLLVSATLLLAVLVDLFLLPYLLVMVFGKKAKQHASPKI